MDLVVIRIIYVIDVALFHNGTNCNKDDIYKFMSHYFRNGADCNRLIVCILSSLLFRNGFNCDKSIIYMHFDVAQFFFYLLISFSS